MREEIGERGSELLPDGFCCYFHGLGAILTVGTEESIKYHLEPSSQIPKVKNINQNAKITFSTHPETNSPLRSPEDAPFWSLLTVPEAKSYATLKGTVKPQSGTIR